MFKKYKQLVVGFVLGAVMFSAMPIQATVEEYIMHKANYKVIINNNEIQDALSYNNTTYINLRIAAKAFNADATWDPFENKAEIKSKTIYIKGETNTVEKTVGDTVYLH